MELVRLLFVSFRTMRIYVKLIFLWFVLSAVAHAETANGVITAQSPANRVALLELYTSEGCSSCPPAEQWLSNLKKSGVSNQQLIPLAFHVTYWDYIGWKDKFASDLYDKRQRDIARNNEKRTIYTPQFVLSGNDYRTYNQFTSDVQRIVSQGSVVDLKLSARKMGDTNIDAVLIANTGRSEVKDVKLFMVIYEDDLSSQVNDGENEGELLHHDYVVRQLYGPFTKNTAEEGSTVKQLVEIGSSWKLGDLYLVAFAQDPHTGEILQAVQLKL